MSAGIVVESVSKTFRGGMVRALDGVSLSIAPGEVFGIIGPNGAGKTTLFGCLLGFLRPDAGGVTIDGHAPDDLEVRGATGYLPERLVMDRWMTGRDFLAYHHALARLPAHDRERDVEAAHARVGLEPEAARRPIRKYSRGMLQRLGLAQALLGRPRWLFLDEPASGVDPAGIVLFRRLLLELKGHGVTVLLNSHQLEQVERVCDRVAYVGKGKVEAVETVSAGAGAERVLRVRWSSAERAPAAETLAAVAERAGCSIVGVDPGSARFQVSDDAGASRLLETLIGAGVRVIEATAEEGRLERLFLAGRDTP